MTAVDQPNRSTPFIAVQGTYAQAPQPYQKPDNFRLGDYGRFHGYLNQPVFCGIARCGDNWRRTNATPKPVKARRK